MTSLGLTAMALVAVQLLVTLVFQFRPLSARFATLDVLGIVPRWKFFMAEHGRYDVAIDLRTRHASGTAQAWRTIWTPVARSGWSWLWRPEAFRGDIAWLAVMTLDARAAGGAPACPETSAAYATILDLCRRAAGADVHEGQFAIVRVMPGGERRIRYTSTFHIL